MATSTDTSIPDHDELVQRARALQPLLTAHAVETEKTRRIPDEVLDAIRAAGMLRLSAPRRVGGYQAPFRTIVEVMEVLAQACGSTAWVAGYTNTAKWMASLWNAEAQKDFFAKGPDIIMAGSGNKPSADVRKVDGGYRFSGSWPSLSGIPYADWAGVWIKLPDDGEVPGKVVEAVVPASEVEIVNTWAVAGMKGTGSESVVAKDVFVPAHRTMDVSVIGSNDWRQYPTPYKDEALYRGATHPVLALAVCISPTGLAGGALTYAIERAGKPLNGTSYKEARQSVSFQNQLSEAAMHIETARLFLYRAASDIDVWAEKGEMMPEYFRARGRADCGWIVTHACQAIDMIMTSIGAGAFADSNPLQRYWRDANTGARHGAVNAMLSRELFGKALLGLTDESNMLKV